MAHIRQLADLGSIPSFATKKVNPQLHGFEDFLFITNLKLIVNNDYLLFYFFLISGRSLFLLPHS
jgi:hypothetical protein